MIKISNIVGALQFYSGLSVDGDTPVKDLLSTLQKSNTAIVTLDNINDYIPDWQDMARIKFSFCWQLRLHYMDVNIDFEYKNGTMVDAYMLRDNESITDFIYFSQFRKRLDNIGESYTPEFAKACFSAELLAAFKEHGVELEFPNECDTGTDS
jgi:hypothetical protein